MTQKTLRWMQESYLGAFGAIARMLGGDKVIVHGVEVNGNNVSNGWVIIGNELMPFVGGQLGANPMVTVVATNTDASFFAAPLQRPVYTEKYATIGAPGFPFSQLKKANVGSDLGVVEMWAGDVNKIPVNKVLCVGQPLNVADYPELFSALGNIHGGDGVATFNLPDLRERFIVGYNSAAPDYDVIGKVGGTKEVTLTVQQIPPHKHQIKTHNKGGGDGNTHMGLQALGITRETENAGGGQPHENRPPFFTLAFIMRLK